MFRLSGAVLATCFAVVAALTGCQKHVTQHECNDLLDRYVELLIRSDRPETTSEELLRMQGEAREKATHDPAFLHCTREVTRGEFECAMKAPNADVLEQCLL